jgi:hypothetical protein
MTEAQRRLVEIIKAYGEDAEYWPVVNDWVRDSGRTKALALRNINRTMEALIRADVITIDDNGLFHLQERTS